MKNPYSDDIVLTEALIIVEENTVTQKMKS